MAAPLLVVTASHPAVVAVRFHSVHSVAVVRSGEAHNKMVCSRTKVETGDVDARSYRHAEVVFG